MTEEVKNNPENLPDEVSLPVELNYEAKAGAPLAQGVQKAQESDITAALKSVQDPELMLNIFDLGLIYEIKQEENGDVFVLMTLTSPTCPMGDEIIQRAAQAVSSVIGVGEVTVRLTFDPPWTTDRLSEEIKLMMGI